MFSLFKNLRKRDYLFLFFSLILIVTQVWLELKIPDYTKNLSTIVHSEGVEMREVLSNGGLMLLCALGSLISAIVCSLLISNMSSSFSRTLREKLFDKISSFSESEIRRFSTSSLITRTTNDVMQMQNFTALGTQLMFKAPIMAIWAICKISVTNIKWTMAVLISVIIIVVCISILLTLCIPRFKRIQKLTDELNNITRENIAGVRVVRAFNAEAYQEEKFDNVNKKIFKNNLMTDRTMSIMNPVMTLVMNSLMVSIYWIGAIIINSIVMNADNMMIALTERIDVIGNMAAFTQYAMQVVMSFMMLVMIFVILPRTMVSAKRIDEVLKTKATIIDGDNQIPNDIVSGEIEFRNVSFSYDDSKTKEYALTDINLKINKGETVAIIGATGSGKTTLINLIPRFYDVSKGSILVDGIDVKKYSKYALRDKISVASQKAILFKGNIKENVTLGSEVIDEQKINKALDIAQADFVKNLDKGIESSVSQGGTNFSGGQKQRLSIARALYKDSEIIIFDDSFSALDYKTDMKVRSGIKKNLKDTTVIIVAQRIGTVKNADKIVVLDDGKIVGVGKHKDLLKNCQIYKEIALSQLSKEEL